jgi:hypothetical protein
MEGEWVRAGVYPLPATHSPATRAAARRPLPPLAGAGAAAARRALARPWAERRAWSVRMVVRRVWSWAERRAYALRDVPLKGLVGQVSWRLEGQVSWG